MMNHTSMSHMTHPPKNAMDRRKRISVSSQCSTMNQPDMAESSSASASVGQATTSPALIGPYALAIFAILFSLAFIAASAAASRFDGVFLLGSLSIIALIALHIRWHRRQLAMAQACSNHTPEA